MVNPALRANGHTDLCRRFREGAIEFVSQPKSSELLVKVAFPGGDVFLAQPRLGALQECQCPPPLEDLLWRLLITGLQTEPRFRLSVVDRNHSLTAAALGGAVTPVLVHQEVPQ